MLEKIPVEPEWLPPSKFAKKIGTTEQRLANDRYLGRGLPYSKHGRNILYHWPTCSKILKDRMVYPEREECACHVSR